MEWPARLSSGKQTEMRYLGKNLTLTLIFLKASKIYENYEIVSETSRLCTTEANEIDKTNDLKNEAANKAVDKMSVINITNSMSTLREGRKLIPVKIYANAASLKKLILADNRGLSGIYR